MLVVPVKPGYSDAQYTQLARHIGYMIGISLDSSGKYDNDLGYMLQIGVTEDSVVVVVEEVRSLMFWVKAIWNIPTKGFKIFRGVDYNSLEEVVVNVINATETFPILLSTNEKDFTSTLKKLVGDMNIDK